VLFCSGVEGKQTAKGEKVTGLVPRVEKEAEMLDYRSASAECAESCNLISTDFIAEQQAERGLWLDIFCGAIDFSPAVGYANTTFAVRPPSD
jgi:hypothetical protein